MVETVKCFMCKLEREVKLHNYASDAVTSCRRWIQTHCPKGLTRCSTALMVDGVRKKKVSFWKY